MSRSQDIYGIIRGIQLVLTASARTQEEYLRHLWSHSSIRDLLEKNVAQTQQCGKKVFENPTKELENIGNVLKETLERSSLVAEGVRKYAQSDRKPHLFSSYSDQLTSDSKPFSAIKGIENLDIASITLKELENLLAEHNKIRSDFPTTRNHDAVVRVEKKPVVAPKIEPVKVVNIEAVASASAAVPEPTPPPPPPEPISTNLDKDTKKVESMINLISNYSDDRTNPIPIASTAGVPELKSVAKQRTVPSTRMGRVMSFGQLFAGLGVGTVAEMTKGAFGFGKARNMREAFLSPQNAERIVDTLCKVRGAALKLGQILSIQDTNVVSPQLIQAFDRVRQAADYMPDWQVEKVMLKQLGADWRTKFGEFEEKPFAAASIGQVHRGKLHDGTNVAIKIQYPGVARSIDSDIDNLVSMLKVWDIFPPGMYIDNVVKVAKRELAWEVDYVREAEFTATFREMIKDYETFYVPKVYPELSTERLITTEFVPGIPMDACFNMSQEQRNHIGRMVMHLCLIELFEFRCMQTDPNWSNFLYDEESKRLMLIDFGASRFYTRKFMDNYLRVIIAATENNRDLVRKLSVEMGFLTGYESQVMADAHVDAVMILGEVFSVKGEFEFGKQKTTKKIADLVPVMVAHRLCAPPEEIYSLHRKLSGVFLLCYKLQAKFAARPMFDEIVKNYKFDSSS